VWPASPGRVLRVSAQVYNEESQYVRLASALKEALAAGA
jgi:selenocysteine lyase/cysteine desulfurase